MDKALRVLAWIVSVFFFIGGAGMMFTGQPAAGLFSIGVAACAFPPLWRAVETKGIRAPVWARWAGALILMIGAGANTPTTTADGSDPMTRPVGGPAVEGAARPAAETRPGAPVAKAAPTKWRVSEDVSALDDSRNVQASLEAEDKVQGWLGSERPTLYARCKEGETEVYIDTKSQIHSELDFNAGESLAAVKYRVGAGAPRSARVGLSTDGSALFLPQPVALLNQLQGADRFVIEYTPFQAGLGTAVFQIGGAQDVAAKIAAACNWKPAAL